MSVSRDQARELLAFYQEAGVDALLEEAPSNRFAGDEAPPVPQAEAIRPTAGGRSGAPARPLL